MFFSTALSDCLSAELCGFLLSNRRKEAELLNKRSWHKSSADTRPLGPSYCSCLLHFLCLVLPFGTFLFGTLIPEGSGWFVEYKLTIKSLFLA